MFDLDRIGGLSALHALVDEVLGAGALALHIQERGAAMERKDDASPVTEADRAVEARLRAYLSKTYPKAGFLGEESGAQAGQEFTWIVDPIDGTRAFVRSIPTWSVLVGLEADGVPVLGIAFLPAAEDLFVAYTGGGATHNGRPCRVSTVDQLGDALVGHGAIQQFTETGHEDALLRLARGTYTQRGFADFANYRALLLGRMDAVVDPGVQPYDVAPAAVLVQEAGGRFSDLKGAETIHGDGFVASNGATKPSP
ncbi:MAG: inositol monophosphatase family protein [Myxococcota bacterium]